MTPLKPDRPLSLQTRDPAIATARDLRARYLRDLVATAFASLRVDAPGHPRPRPS
jgi:hypothetical protein